MDNQQLFNVGDMVRITEGEYADREAKVGAVQATQYGFEYLLLGLRGYQGNRYTCYQNQLESLQPPPPQIPEQTSYGDVSSTLTELAGKYQQMDSQVVEMLRTEFEHLRKEIADLKATVGTKEVRISVEPPRQVPALKAVSAPDLDWAEVERVQSEMSSPNGDQMELLLDQEQEIEDGTDEHGSPEFGT